MSWLNEIAGVLTTGGQVRLAIPDRRYTFDYARAETTIADVMEDHGANAWNRQGDSRALSPRMGRHCQVLPDEAEFAVAAQHCELPLTMSLLGWTSTAAIAPSPTIAQCPAIPEK